MGRIRRVVVLLLLLLFGWGCSEHAWAERPWTPARGRQAAVLSAADATATTGRTWTVAFGGEDCESPTWATWSDLKATDDLANQASGWSCDIATTGLAAAGLGSVRAGKAVDLNGGCWSKASTAFGGLSDESELLIRLIIYPTATANTIVSDYLYSGLNYWRVRFASTSLIEFTIRDASTSYIKQTSISAGAWALVDIHYQDGAGNPTTTVYVNGTATAHAAATGDIGAVASGGTLSLGGTSACAATLTGDDVVWFSIAAGSDASWFTGESVHDADCAALGLC